MNRAPSFLLYINVLVVATCGLMYELLAGTLASFVLGDSVTQFSTVIGTYLGSMGVGAWLSRFVKERTARCFIEVELGVALLGGFSAPLLFLGFAKLHWFGVVLYGIVFLIGVLVGLELPLLMRILKDHVEFSDLVSRVLAFDYIGAVVASLLFPILLVPHLGLIRTSLLFGILNAAVGLWGTYILEPLLGRRLGGVRGRAVLVIGLLATGFIKADALTKLAEEDLFEHEIVYTKQSRYQRIVITKSAAGFRLFLNGHLQFHSGDEYRYHEALVHPPLLLADEPKRVLVLGGGDGLAVREILKHPTVKSITVVDLDPAMTGLADEFKPLRELNGNSLHDPRVTVINQDAMLWLEETVRSDPDARSVRVTHAGPFDVAIIDFPDPNSFSLGKLYTRRFYRLLRRRLTPNAAVAIQCTSPLIARQSYWCVVRTLESAGFATRPYCISLASFGVWGYVLAKPSAFEAPSHIPSDLQSKLKYLNTPVLRTLFTLPPDIGPVEVEINRLNNQRLVRYYESEWKKWK